MSTPMSSILRRWAGGQMQPMYPDDVKTDAADEIDELVAENVRLREWLYHLQSEAEVYGQATTDGVGDALSGDPAPEEAQGPGADGGGAPGPKYESDDYVSPTWRSGDW